MTELHWLKISPSLNKGIAIINQLEDTRYEQFLRRIIAKLNTHVAEIFNENEREKLEKIFKIDQETLLFIIKTIIYVFKRLLKYIFMPVDLKKDLKTVGFNSEKADIIVKVWSNETRTTINDLGSDVDITKDKLNFTWKMHAELSSHCCKKSKVAKAYIGIVGDQQATELELTHSELHSIFIQLESIQNEIDTFA